jgi:hypothetical protein
MAWISHSYLMKLWRDAFIRLERMLCEPVIAMIPRDDPMLLTGRPHCRREESDKRWNSEQTVRCRIL